MIILESLLKASNVVFFETAGKLAREEKTKRQIKLNFPNPWYTMYICKRFHSHTQARFGYSFALT